MGGPALYFKHPDDFATIKPIRYLCAMPTSALLIFCTCPNKDTGERIANSLIDQGLAACINITPPITSIYTWQGQRESAQEVLLLIKTSQDRYTELEQAIRSLHPYELPEIIAVPVEQGLAGYLEWINQCTTKSS